MFSMAQVWAARQGQTLPSREPDATARLPATNHLPQSAQTHLLPEICPRVLQNGLHKCPYSESPAH